MISTSLIVGGSAFLLAAILTPALGRMAHRWKLLDHPGGRKLHGKAVPLTGGVAIFWATVAPLGVLGARALIFDRSSAAVGALAFVGDGTLLLSVLAGAALLHIGGLIDDRRDLSVPVKLAVQFVAVLPLLALPGMVLLPGWLPHWLGLVVTVLWCLVVINAFNFLDGMDGLLGGVGIICAAELAAVSVLMGQWTTALVLFGLVGALAGFLLFNFPPARSFAGDNGSLVVGYILAFASVRITYYDLGFSLDTPPHAVLAPLVILGLPLYDFASVLWLRTLEGRNPLTGDNSHLSHRLLYRGLSSRQALFFICACTLAVGVGGVLLIRVTAAQALLVAIQALTVLFLLALMEWTSRPAPRE
jgi:UDP-GlcNAc:undecaprenyl-phosphate/decaprenyl-phosphate GlcNAc-1-phosphate transferase